MRCAFVIFRGLYQRDFFKARFAWLTFGKGAGRGTLFGQVGGSARHWQSVRNTYSTAQNTSYRSTVRRTGAFARAFQ